MAAELFEVILRNACGWFVRREGVSRRDYIMKKSRRVAGAIIALVIIISAPLISDAIEAGAAARDYTPPVDEMRVPLGGYGARFGKRAKGIHDPVFVKALALKDNETLVVIATMDIVGVPPLVRNRVIQDLEYLGLRDDNFLITASHSHSAPAAMDKNFIEGIIFGRYNEKLMERTASIVADAVREAVDNLAPAKLSIAQGKVEDLTRNRRDPSYNYDTRRFSKEYDPLNPRNITDDTMTVLRVDDAQGRPIAAIVHFATHATVLGADNFLVSADWPGVMQRELEAAYPGMIAMYMNGAEGDQAPAMPDNPDDFECMEIIGKRAALAAKPLIESAKTVNAEPISSVMVRRKVESGVSALGIPLPKFIALHYFPAMPLMVVRVGDAAFLGAPLEMVSGMGWTIKRSAAGFGISYPVAAGLANELYLYCATPDDFPTGGYEVYSTMYGEIEAGLVIGELMMLLDKVD